MYWLTISRVLGKLLANQEKIMATLADVDAALTALEASGKTAEGLLTQVLAALGPQSTAAQALVDRLNADNATVQAQITAMQAVLNPGTVGTTGTAG